MGAVGRGGSLEYQELLGVISSSVLQGDLRELIWEHQKSTFSAQVRKRSTSGEWSQEFGLLNKGLNGSKRKTSSEFPESFLQMVVGNPWVVADSR